MMVMLRLLHLRQPMDHTEDTFEDQGYVKFLEEENTNNDRSMKMKLWYSLQMALHCRVYPFILEKSLNRKAR